MLSRCRCRRRFCRFKFKAVEAATLSQPAEQRLKAPRKTNNAAAPFDAVL